MCARSHNSNMKSKLTLAVLCGIFILLQNCALKPKVAQEGDSSLSFPSEVRISNLRQLTFEGQNAEAYFSYNDSHLVFQHSGKNAKCDQIYTIQVDGKNQRRISSGKGRQTCGFFSAKDRFVIYSSTELASAECPESSKIPGVYTWPVFSTYQLFSYNPSTKKSKPAEPGAANSYNAELTSCRDGKVIFTSTRDGDLELYTGRVDSDGFIKDVKRLTNHLGYDGGAVFSKNCEWITWRRSSPETDKEKQEYVDLLRKGLVKPSKLEIWESRVDGSQARQITRLKAASFGPVYSPSQEQIVFSTNYFDPKGRVFDLVSIKRNGTELEKLTDSKSFDAFPMFSNDGKLIAFSSNRNGRVQGETNLFIGDWDEKVPAPLITEEDSESSNRAFSIIRELSAPDFEGRGVGSDGLKRAEGYMIELFEKYGIKPYFDQKSFEQKVPVRLGVKADWNKTSMRADWKNLVIKTDFAPASFSTQGQLSGYIADAGYGLYIPEKGVDDYYKANVKGKIALIRRRVPKNLGLTAQQERSYADMKYKAYLAKDRGAIGVLFWDPEGPEPTVEESPSKPEEKTVTEDLTFTLDDSSIYRSSNLGIPVVLISRKIANDFLKSPKTVRIEAQISLKDEIAEVSNVVGQVGQTCGTDAPVVLGAHFDHLGLKSDASFEPFGRGLHHGADDNASGVAALLEAARVLRDKTGCYIIAGFTAEEIGVLGSHTLVKALQARGVTPKAMINFDMVGRLQNNEVAVFGTDSSSRWNRHLQPACKKEHLKCVSGGDGLGPSDHMPFFLAQIPVVHFFTGNHADYHRSTDTSDKINATGVAQIAATSADLAERIAQPKVVLPFAKSSLRRKPKPKTDASAGAGHGLNPYLGTIPDYSPGADKTSGVLLAGVKADSPAEAAGVRAKDIITGIFILDEKPGYPRSEPVFKKVENLDVYTFVLKSLEPGLKIRIRVERNGRSLELPATVGRRSSGIE